MQPDEPYTPEAVARAIGLESLTDDHELREAARGARALFRPAFHPECSLTAMQRQGSTTIALHTAQTNLWYWAESTRRQNEESSARDRPSPPAPWHESAEAPEAKSRAFWAEIDDLDLRSITSSGPLGADGVTVNGVLTDDGAVTQFETWTPEPQSAEFRLAAALWGLGDGVLREDQSIRLLEQLHRYLSLGPPIKVVPGNPTAVRIFGGLSVDDESELRAALRQVPSDAAVLMDMSNLDGMGTLLHDLFAEFARRTGSTAWVASQGALDHLKEIGVPSAMIFNDRAEAQAHLRAAD